MKQIYDFEQHRPPAVTERLLRQRLKKRRLQWQTALLALAAVLVLTMVILLGYAALDWYPAIAGGCFVYVCVSVLGGVAIALAHAGKGGHGNVKCLGN